MNFQAPNSQLFKKIYFWDFLVFLFHNFNSITLRSVSVFISLLFTTYPIIITKYFIMENIEYLFLENYINISY